MGEVRNNVQEAVMEEFEDADKDQQEKLLSFFDKYNPIDKEEEEELEK